MSMSALNDEVAAWPEQGPSRVPAWIYSDPDLFRRELETFH